MLGEDSKPSLAAMPVWTSYGGRPMTACTAMDETGDYVFESNVGFESALASFVGIQRAAGT
jgi:hypothetical protein